MWRSSWGVRCSWQTCDCPAHHAVPSVEYTCTYISSVTVSYMDLKISVGAGGGQGEVCMAEDALIRAGHVLVS